MNLIRGEVGVEIGGEKRTLICDMQAAEALYQTQGPYWLLWLYERFIGKPTTLPGGTKVTRLEPLSPKELVVALHGMLATDRARSGREDTVESLMRSISPFAFGDLQSALTRAVLASAGVPGEVKEAEPAAAAVPPGSEPGPTPGTGKLS